MRNEAFFLLTSLLVLMVWLPEMEGRPPGPHEPPRWRTYTSSSFYYTDYTYPKHESPLPPKHKFVPDPQFCPDTGRTICNGAPNYPDEHIYEVINGSKGRRFNFSTVFVDERDGDTEPNSNLLPESAPMQQPVPVHRDGYVVYQTSIHYDYHVPPAVPWLYGSAASTTRAPDVLELTHNVQSPMFLSRRRPLLRRHQRADNLDEKSACPVRTMFVPPRAALSDTSEWRYIVNVQNKDSRFKQIIRVDVCESPDQPCTNEISLPYGYVSRCKQKFIKKKLLALDADGQGTSASNFFIPSCCVCHVSRSARRNK